MIKLIKDVVVKQYELTYLLPDFFTSAEVAKVTTELETLVKKYSGKILSTQEWGKKELAYKIKHGSKVYDRAGYTHLVLECPTEKVTLFERDLYLNEKIIRHLLVVAEKSYNNEEKAAEAKVKVSVARKVVEDELVEKAKPARKPQVVKTQKTQADALETAEVIVA